MKFWIRCLLLLMLSFKGVSLFAQTNLPPEISVSGRNAYCPLDQILIAENFNITDPDDTGINEFSVQISSGYVIGTDLLSLTGSHPTINATWNNTEGKLTLTPIGSTEIAYVNLIPAVQDIVYQSLSATVSGERFFSFNIGDANYLPSTDHYYEYVADDGIDWESARIAAENRTYFGLQGYLATILSADEAQLSGEQAAGTGWIGGSDAAAEGVWRWVTGPEAGTIFWNGGINGTTPNFAFWNNNEPNNLGNEDYAHVTDPSIGVPGSWNDLPLIGGSGLYVPRGYIVEYGGMPGDPILNISGSTSIYIPVITSPPANTEICENETATLMATVSEGDVFWYDTPVAGNLLNVGDTFVTPVLTATTTYYAAAGPANCANTPRVAVEITVQPQPTIGNLGFTTYEQCDNDGTDDGFFTFDLNALFETTLINGQDTTVFDVVFYQSQGDADMNTNAITNPDSYTNAAAFVADEIFARVINISAPDICTPATTSFELLVQPNPAIGATSDIEFCDNDADGDDTNGFVQSFVLSSNDSDILNGLNPADFTVSYHTNATDAENNDNALDKLNPIANTTAFTQPIFVRLTDNNTACFSFTSTAHFNLVVHPLPVVTNPVLLELCDTDQDGQASFDLTTANTLISADAANETFRYFETEAAAQTVDIAQEITTPTSYINMVDTSDAVWVRTSTVNGCFRVSQLNLSVTTTTVSAAFQRTYEQCDDYLDINGDDNANNDDTDGVATFNFADATALLLAPFPDAQESDISITYYESLADANAATNAIADISNHRNINSPNTQQIFIRVENAINNTCLYTGTHITLIVNPTPTANPVTDLDICDDDADGDDTNGFIQSIDLESQTAGILDTQDPTQFTVSYHESAADATSNSNPLASPFTNTTATTQTIYVRVTDNNTGCFTDRSSFDVNIRPLPVITANVELKQCDDDVDGFAPFNLFEAGELISTNSVNESFEFFETLADAQAGVNQIPNPTAYTNQMVTTDIVWARAISSFDCYRISEVTLTVATNSSQVTTFPPRTYNVCDDFLDINGDNNINNDDTDGITTFNFSDFTDAITAVFPLAEQPFLDVEYYRDQDDALAELNEISNPGSYRNIGFPGTQQIYVRVDNSQNNECIGFFPLITLIVDPVPVANPVPDLQECDNADDGDFTNGFVQVFDLDSQTATILGTQDPTLYTVTYHTSALDANQGTNAIVNTSAYTNTTANQQTIYVRVTHNIQGCFVDRLTFDLIVNPLPIANFVEDLPVCDNLEGGSNQDGFANGIDLEVQTAGILGTQDPANFTVTYHESLADAQAGNNAIVSPYTNITASVQIIYVRIVNNTTTCANGISNFNLIINPEPTATDIIEFPVCDNDEDGDDTNGFVQNVDLDSKISEILGPDQDEDDYTVTFHASQLDAQMGASPLISPYANSTQGGETIYVRVVNDDTGCANDDTFFELVINPLPEFDLPSPQIVCLNGPELILGPENPADGYDYVWTDAEGNELSVNSLLTVTSGGLYILTATAIDGTGCSRVRRVQVNESIIATLDIANVEIDDETDSDNTITIIDPTLLGIGDYEYALADENGEIIRNYQDEPMFGSLEGGFYTILARDKNGCGVASLDVPVVVFPKFFTPNNDGVNDTWAIKGANSIFFPESQVSIFNRFGKVIAQISIDNAGWNGTFNGKVLPSDDYWFFIKLTDRQGKTREKQGNFSLLRRGN